MDVFGILRRYADDVVLSTSAQVNLGTMLNLLQPQLDIMLSNETGPIESA